MSDQTFEVTVRRTVYQYQTINVRASNKLSAQEMAEEQLEDDQKWEGVSEADVEIEALPIDSEDDE